MIESIKDLEKLLKLCRKQGVTEIKLAGCEFKLGDLPQEDRAEADHGEEIPNEPLMGLSEEELIYWSAGQDPRQQGAQ